MTTKRPKIEIGTTFPHFHEDRYVNAEIVDCIRVGSRNGIRKRNWWKVRLTESQQPVVRTGGKLAGEVVEFEADTKSLSSRIASIESLPTFSPKSPQSAVVQWIEFPSPRGLWCEIREEFTYAQGRNTHWTKSEYGDVESLLASGDAVRVNQ